MKIVEFCLSPDLGGLELFMLNCYENFKQREQTFLVVDMDKKLDKHTDANKFYLTRSKFFPFLPAIKFAKFIDKNDIDIVHFHWTKDMITVVLAKLLSHKKPKVVQTRNMSMTRFKDDFYHRWIYKNIELMHSVTFEVEKQLKKYIPKDIRPKIKTIYMGVDKPKVNIKKIESLKEKYHIKNDDFLVGIIGRIEDAKGQYLLIEALSKLKKIKALIVGHTMDKKYLNSLKQKVKSLDLEDRVIFTGFTKDVNEHLHLCKCSVLATKKETFGLVVIESMANKTPVIATNSGGPLEIIEDEIDGLLYERNSEDLAKKIDRVYQDREFLKVLSENGYTKVREKFNKEKNLNTLYGALCES